MSSVALDEHPPWIKRLVRGMSNREIADRLVITERTACTRVSNILTKLHLASRTQAALYALQKGLSSRDDIPAIEEG